MRKINFINPDSVRVDDEFSSIFGPLDMETELALTESLRHGFDDSKGKITVWFEPENEYPVIVDGHNRFRICREEGILLVSSYFVEKKFLNRQEVIAWILDTQLSRRNLTDVERVELLEKYRDILVARGKENMSAGGKGSTILSKVDTRKECAARAGMSEGKYSEIRSVLTSDDEDTKQELRSGKLSAHAAAQKVKEKKTAREKSKDEILKEKMKRLEQIEDRVLKLEVEKNQILSEAYEIVLSEADAEMGFIRGKDEKIFLFFLEYRGFTAPIYTGDVSEMVPTEEQMSKCPTYRREEFIALWQQAREQCGFHQSDWGFDDGDWDDDERSDDERGSGFCTDDIYPLQLNEIRSMDPAFRKKVGKVISKHFHQDNNHTKEESQWANAISEFLKAM